MVLSWALRHLENEVVTKLRFAWEAVDLGGDHVLGTRADQLGDKAYRTLSGSKVSEAPLGFDSSVVQPIQCQSAGGTASEPLDEDQIRSTFCQQLVAQRSFTILLDPGKLLVLCARCLVAPVCDF